MADREIVQVVELDLDRCDLTWGTSPCLAAFGDGVVRKCYNTFGTCSYTQAYTKGVTTLRFVEGSYSIKTGNYIPALVSVSGHEQEVNIAGFSSKVSGIGVRASRSITIDDFPYGDVLTDKYWAERISGAAQIDEPGYQPRDRGSFWSKFKARNPNYAGRPLRVIQAHHDGAGGLVYDTVRSYVMDEFTGPQNGRVTIRAKDILSLADDKKAMAPIVSRGRLLTDITNIQASVTLTPTGIGAEYPASGWATVGSEIVSFARFGDVMVITRGEKGTEAAAHSANDTFQIAFDVVQARGDAVIYDLLVNYGNVPPAYIDFAEWQAEFDRWGTTMLLTATVCKPTGVTQLIGEISQLGVTVWWDEVAQKVRVKINRPPSEIPVVWSDRNNIMSITQEDNDDERATRIEIWSVQINPTREINKDNFSRGDVFVAVEAESPNMFGTPRTHEILTRWLNHGDAKAVNIMGTRLRNRYRRAPVTYKVQIDAKDDPGLTDVIQLDSYVTTDDTGAIKPTLTQVFYRADDKNGSTVNAKLQMFQFDVNYGSITENDRPVYSLSTDEQKRKGVYFVGPSLVFADGRKAYSFI